MRAGLVDVLQGGFADGRELAAVDRTTALRRSIQDHLIRLLNSRAGALPHLPEYGLPDLNEVYRGMPYSINWLADHVRRLIERYEPRLDKVRVLSYPNDKGDFAIHLEISGVVNGADGVRFQTYFTSGGSAQVAIGSARMLVDA